MIRSIKIKNFKLYHGLVSFDGLSNINLLTGVNGRGKSTLLQSMLLPKQSIIDSEWADKISLCGEYVNLGNSKDVRNIKASRSETISFEYDTDDGNLCIEFSSDEDDRQKLDVDKVVVNGNSYPSKGIALNGFIPKNETVNEGLAHLVPSFNYISAERIGPKMNYKPAPDKNQMDAIGESVANVLYAHKDDSVSETLLDGLREIFPMLSEDELDDKSINGIVDFWLSKMFGRTKVKPSYLQAATVYVLNYDTDGMRECKPTNIGYGYTFVLPILVAGLVAKHGSTLIIENPEAHLHPMAQSIIGKFIGWLAKFGGVQFFVESHSEHIINSFRVMVAQEVLSAGDVNIEFFDDAYPDCSKKIVLDEHGRIEEWPVRFFDQEEQDLDILV